jgi:diacylglycerol kinase (ATP)
MRHILYIINPISGRSNKSTIQQLIGTSMKKSATRFSVYPSVSNGDYSFLDEQIKKENVTDIVIAGGDGTINQAIASLKHWSLPFGIIPCGSGNGLAFSAGIPKDPQKAINIIINGKIQGTDAFSINGSFACMLCGLGFDAQVAHDFANDPKRGLATYIRKTVANFFTANAYPFSISVKNEEVETEAFFISIANSNQFGNNFKIAPKASLTDGLLDIVIVTKQNKLNLLFSTARQVSGMNSLQQASIARNKGSIIYFQTENLVLRNPAGAPMHIDGDPVESIGELNISILPKAFKLLIPG